MRTLALIGSLGLGAVSPVALDATPLTDGTRAVPRANHAVLAWMRFLDGDETHSGTPTTIPTVAKKTAADITNVHAKAHLIHGDSRG